MVDSPAGSSPARRKDSTTTPECKDDPSSSDSAASVLTQKKSNRSATTMRSVSFAVSVKPPATPGSASLVRRPEVKSHTKHFRRRKKRKNPLSKRPIASSTPPLSTMNEAAIQAQVTANLAQYTQIVGLTDPDSPLLAIFQSLDMEGQMEVLYQLSFLPILDQDGAPTGEAARLVNTLLSDICIAQAFHVLAAGHGPVGSNSVLLNKDGLDEVAFRDVDRGVRRLLRELHHLALEPGQRREWYDWFQTLGIDATDRASSQAAITAAVNYVNRFRNLRSPAKVTHYTGYDPAATSLAWQSMYHIFHGRIADPEDDEESVHPMDVDAYPEAEIDDAEAGPDVPPPPAVEGDGEASLTESGGSMGRVLFPAKSVEEHAFRLFLKNYASPKHRGESRLRHFRRLSDLDQSLIMDVLPIFAGHVSLAGRGPAVDKTIRDATLFLVNLAVTVKVKYRIYTDTATRLSRSARNSGIIEMVGDRSEDLLRINRQYVTAMGRWVFNITSPQARRFVANKLMDLWQSGEDLESRSEGPDDPSPKRRRTVDIRDLPLGEDVEVEGAPPIDTGDNTGGDDNDDEPTMEE